MPLDYDIADLDTWTRPKKTTLITVKLPDGRTTRGQLLEIFTRQCPGGLCVQYYVKYDDGRNGLRVRIVDPVTMQRWVPRVKTLGTAPEANYKAIK